CQVGHPAGLPQVVVVGADGDGSPADRGEPWITAGILDLRGDLGVPAGEVDRDALDGGPLEHALPGGDHALRHWQPAYVPRTGHHVGNVVGDNRVQRVEQPVTGDLAVADDVGDPRRWSHPVHGLHVERAFHVAGAVRDAL